jgi:hypothetical protein
MTAAPVPPSGDAQQVIASEIAEPEYLSDEQVVDIIEYPDDHCSHCGPVASELLARRKQEAAIRALCGQQVAWTMRQVRANEYGTHPLAADVLRILDGEDR